MISRLAALILSAAAAFAAAAAEPQVDLFSPQGEAKAARQARARFSEPMVAFGDPRLADPFTVKCTGDPARHKGRGRWVDARNWAWDFEADLPAGQRCTFTLLPDVAAVDGQKVGGKREFTFHTGGPLAVGTLPREGSTVDEEQAFLLAFDAPIDRASLKEGWCEAKGINERIPLVEIPQKETDEILAANKAHAYRFYRLMVKGPNALAFHEFKVEDKRFRQLPLVGVRCARKLPPEAELAVVIGEKVKTRTGMERGVAQRLAFKVRPAFSVSFSCQRVNKDAHCLPVTSMRVGFSAPVPASKAAGVRLRRAGGLVVAPRLEARAELVDSVEFPGPFAEGVKFSLELPRGFTDDVGREPANLASFPLVVQTDAYPPLVKFPGRFGILESADPVLPVSVRAVETPLAGTQVEVKEAPVMSIPGRTLKVEGDESLILQRYLDFMQWGNERVPGSKKDSRPGEVSAIAKEDPAQPIAMPRPASHRMEVLGIPMKKPGFYIVELASPRLGEALHGEKKPYYVATSVLVTNLAVHLKHGRERSLVWVTRLSDGKPVADAEVNVRDCRGRALHSGRSDADGVVDIAQALPLARSYPPCPLAAFARVGDDLSFTLSSWREGIEPWNYSLNTGWWNPAPLAIHTVFDRTLFRAGETVSMKHIARVPSGDGFRIPAAESLPRRLSIVHLGSDEKVDLPVTFDAQGVAETRWRIPKEGKMGAWQVSWPRSVRSNAMFRVEAFRVPLMRATLAPPKAALVKPKEARLDAAVVYLAGGPAAALPIRVRHRVEPRAVSFADYPDFQFTSETLKEGTQTGPATDEIEAYDPDQEAPEGEAGGGGAVPAARALVLDAAGTAAIVVDKLPATEHPASLAVEMEYNDPNGERLATSTRVSLHPAGLYVGLRTDGWAATKAGVNLQAVVLDTEGKPVAGREVAIEIFERKVYSSRRRVLGGFYAYDSVTETKKVGQGCSGRSDARGLVFCSARPGATGELLFRARAADDAGRPAFATTSVWVVGDGEWWFDPASADRIDLVPEKRRYEPGETARFQVRMPFRSATVLVTVEREGVLSHRIVALDAKSPVIEVPMAGTYGPNVFVSALAVRGRIPPGGAAKTPRSTGLVDLAKPAYKLGVAEVKVGRREYELGVKVTPSRPVFKVREKATVDIAVTDFTGAPAVNAEVALAAVDEGLLELSDNASWNILDALLGQRPIEVYTATAQGHVIGKRHFGRKAVAAGGGGGAGGSRELFDTLLLWRGRVKLDANGRAQVEIPLNDSLTSFRLVAVAHAGAAKFGHGQSTIRTTQDLMLFSGLPPVVREGDEFGAMLTLRNATAAPLESKLAWAVYDGPAAQKSRARVAGGEVPVAMAASESRLVTVPMKVPPGSRRLHWEIGVTGPAGARDNLRVTQEVIEVHPVRVYQATLAQLDKPLSFPVEQPAGSIPGRGGVRVEVMASLAGDLAPLREWFQYYPYSCLEQRASKAIGLRDDALWTSVVSSLPGYLDGDGLARYFPSDDLQGSDVLTAYLVQVAEADGRDLGATVDRMLEGLTAFATGRITRGSALPTADLAIRRLAAIEALARHGRARPQMLDAIAIDPARWPTSALIDWIGILQRVEGVKDRAARRDEALSILRSRLNFQGTVMTFSTERNDALWWLMVSADTNANRALLTALAEPGWKDDVGRMVRGALSRQLRGAWGTTVANAWGTVALDRYVQAFEKVPASGTVTAAIGRREVPIVVKEKSPAADLPWPEGRETFSLEHDGKGAPWAIVQSRAALPLKEPLSTGYAIRRTVTPVERAAQGAWTRGDVYRVSLEIDAQSDMTWVVVDDPIPGGGAILGTGLGRDAAMLARGERSAGWAWPAYVERTHSAYRAYYAFVPKGRFKVEYTVRLNNAGRFDLPATRVEAMYAPEMLGEVPNAAMVVNP